MFIKVGVGGVGVSVQNFAPRSSVALAGPTPWKFTQFSRHVEFVEMKHNEPSSATQALLVAVRVDVALRALPIGDQGPEICCAVSNVPRLLQLMTSLPLTGGALVNMAAACNFAAEARIPRPLARIINLIS